jgi:antitoxin ParD1/3/4
MNVSLTVELEQYVHQKVESGMYHSASEVIREGLRLLKEQDELHMRRLEGLRREVAIGVAQADRGQVKPFTEETVERIKIRGRKRLAAKNGVESQ